MAFFNFENKKVFYREAGHGPPLLLLHGNTASSKMFVSVLKKYSEVFRVILIDFPGHGRSERLESFETDFWHYNARAVYALTETLGLEKVYVIGSSGGALVAINLALEHPGRVLFLVADSFEGEYPLPSYIDSIESDRKRDKKKLAARIFWFYCHGFGWKKIVDEDTRVNIAFYRSGRSFFHKAVDELIVPAILTGSMQDEYCSQLDRIYAEMKDKNNALGIHMFPEGHHPAMLSNKDDFFNLVREKINTMTRAEPATNIKP